MVTLRKRTVRERGMASPSPVFLCLLMLIDIFSTQKIKNKYQMSRCKGYHQQERADAFLNFIV